MTGNSASALQARFDRLIGVALRADRGASESVSIAPLEDDDEPTGQEEMERFADWDYDQHGDEPEWTDD